MSGFFDFLIKIPGGRELIKEFNGEIQKFLKVWQEHLDTDKKEHQENKEKLNKILLKLKKKKE